MANTIDEMHNTAALAMFEAEAQARTIADAQTLRVAIGRYARAQYLAGFAQATFEAAHGPRTGGAPECSGERKAREVGEWIASLDASWTAYLDMQPSPVGKGGRHG